MEKIQALANFLEVNVKEIERVQWDDSVFVVGSEEYLVLTDEEADEKAREFILDTLWAFTPHFIISHCSFLDFDDASVTLINAVKELYEKGNEAILKLIDDIDDFIDDAIAADGRGHFISSYDSEEYQEGDYFIYRVG